MEKKQHITSACTRSPKKPAPGDAGVRMQRCVMSKNEFGSCCKDLKDAMTAPPASFFRVEESGVLYLTVGYVQTKQGPGWFDQAVIYCPFCGQKIQDRDEIAQRANAS
jgi:hypothetical protein